MQSSRNETPGEPPAGDNEASGKALRRGWTTGACATAAAKAACTALLTGDFPDPVTITLPKGQQPSFALAVEERGSGWAMAGVVKDAGDDPDVTHGALIRSRVWHGAEGSGVTFRAGPGVGTVTREGLPVQVGEPAINPVPRQMMTEAVTEVCKAAGRAPDIVVEVSVEHGEKLAAKTLNGRLGIVGGLSILGTTGIVVPYSCASWIASIHRGIDVSRAAGLNHVAASTGDTSEKAAARLHGLPETALLDMGDFVGGTLKYLAKHPVPRLTLAGGFAKFSKLAKGRLDLHSKRHAVDLDWLAARADALGGTAETVAAIRQANTAMQALALAEEAGLPLAQDIAARAQEAALATLGPESGMAVEVLVVARDGRIVATAPWKQVHSMPPLG